VLVSGCGGGSSRAGRPETKPRGGEEQDREAAAGKLPEADRIAYYQLATASGTLRVAAVTRRHGGLGPVVRRLAALRPLDADLRAARSTLVAAVRAFGRKHASSKPALSATDAVNRLLVRYVRRHVSAGVLVPD
jgi:hypothetical protein